MVGITFFVLAAILPRELSAALIDAERSPAILLFISPKQVSSTVPRSTFLEVAGEVLRRQTKIQLLSTEQAGSDLSELSRCNPTTRLTCWVTMTGRTRVNQQIPRYLFALAVHPRVPGEDRLSILVIDLPLALRLYQSASRDEPGWQERVENAIFDSAIRTEPELVHTGNNESLQRFFAGLIAANPPLSALLERKGDLEPFGSVQLKTEPPESGLVVQLDGKTIGTTDAKPVMIRDVNVGDRALSLSRADGSVVSTSTVTVKPGATSNVTLRIADDQIVTFGNAMLVGGIATSIAGVVVTAIAAERSGQMRAACLSRSSASCEETGFTSFGTGEWPTTDPARANPSGLLAAPLGLGLIGAGGLWATGALLFEDSEVELLGITLGAGAVLGVLVYGVLAAAG